MLKSIKSLKNLTSRLKGLRASIERIPLSQLEKANILTSVSSNKAFFFYNRPLSSNFSSSRHENLYYNMSEFEKLFSDKKFEEAVELFKSTLTTLVDSFDQNPKIMIDFSEKFDKLLSNIAFESKIETDTELLIAFFKSLQEEVAEAIGECNHLYFYISLNLAANLESNKDFDAALEQYENCEKMNSSLISVNINFELKEYSQAKFYFEYYLQTRKDNKKENIFDLCEGIERLAFKFWREEMFEETSDIFEASLEIKRERLGAKHESLGSSYSNLADLYASFGYYNEAVDFCTKGVEILDEYYKGKDKKLADILNQLADIHKKYENFGFALDTMTRALEVLAKVYGKNNIYVAMAYRDIGRLLETVNDLQGALASYEKSKEIVFNLFPWKNFETAQAIEETGRVLKKLNRLDEALEEMKKCLEIRISIFGEKNSVEVADTYFQLGEICEARNELQQALGYFYKEFKAAVPPEFADSYEKDETKDFDGTLLGLANKFEELSLSYFECLYTKTAMIYIEKAYKIKLEILGPDHEDVKTLKRQLNRDDE